MALKLAYEDIAVGADQAATVTASSNENFSNPAAVPFGVEPPAIATAELNGWGLSYDYEVKDKQPFGYWSAARSGADCVFAVPPVITIDFSSQQTSTGLTFTFSSASQDYCRKMSVVWYQDGAEKSSGTYYPANTRYVVENVVEAFDRLVITFHQTNLPDRRIKLEKIMIGAMREIEGDELHTAKFVHEVDLISDTLPINVLDVSFHNEKQVDFIFQRTQPVEAYNGEELVGVYYIDDSERTGAKSYSISCIDAIGILDLSEYPGNIWLEETPLTTILNDVIGGLFTVEIDPMFSASKLKGYIPECTRREALQYVAFALGAVVDTSGTRKIRIYPMPTGTGGEIPAAKTYAGGKVEIEAPVTEVTVTAYVFFDERPGENDESVNVNGVDYRYYTETKHAINPNIVATNLPRKIKFQKSYLVNLSNAQTLADNIMAYYMRRENYNVDFVVDGQKVGDHTAVYLPWEPIARDGNITKMTVKYSGIIAAEAEVLLE